jgi:DNA-binding MarR family transcriptional regulator
MDKGYLSRMLKKFEKKKMIKKVISADDKRIIYITLSNYGKSEFEKLNQASNNQVDSILSRLTDKECKELIEKMNSIKIILNKVKD